MVKSLSFALLLHHLQEKLQVEIYVDRDIRSRGVSNLCVTRFR